MEIKIYVDSRCRYILFPGCYGCCCNPCQTYSVAERLGENGVLYALVNLCGFPFFSSFMLRQKARQKYNIQVC